MAGVKYSIVVPVFNSEQSLVELHQRITKVFDKIRESFELILVDDCSRDNSWKVMQKLHDIDNRVKIIQLMRNFGQNNAIMCGFNYANGERVIVMDDDLQHPPEEIPHLISKFNEGYDVVYGQYRKKEHSWFRNLASKIVYGMFTSAAGIKFRVTAFKMIGRKVVDEIIKFKNHKPSIDIYIADIVSPSRISGCVVQHMPRKYGRTNYSFWKLASYALNVVFSFTTYPLRFATIIGFGFSLVSFFLAIFYLVQYLSNNIKVSGFTTLILAITFFSGIILFVIGIVGRYIGNIFLSMNNKPQFAVRNIKK